MKISMNNLPHYLGQQNDSLKTNTRNASKTAGKFDEVKIRQSQDSIPDDKFVTALREKIMADVAKPTPPQQLDVIKSQIAGNTYSVNLDEVARRIMLM